MDISTSRSINVIKAPDERLRAKTKPVKKITPALLQTIKEMVRLTKTFEDPEGVGLASTQIGQNERFFVAKNGRDFIACFNPKIIAASKKTKAFFEGCLSIPDYYGEVKRPVSVTVEYQDKDGQRVIKKLAGISAWIFQHEMDHLNGKLFVDSVLEQKGRMFKAVGKDQAGGNIFEEVKLA